MAPTETTILSAFLLPPSPLPRILTLKAFTELFPRAQQSSPQIKVLYRDLQQQRARGTDTVTRNIAQEVKRGTVQRRAVTRARRGAEREIVDDEVEVEVTLFGPSSNLPSSKPHSLKSILPELEAATEALEDEVKRLDEEARELMNEMRDTVGGLSDLRYGRLENEGLRERVLAGLKRLEGACG